MDCWEIVRRNATDERGCHKEGPESEKVTGFHEMGTVRCDGCGEEFVVTQEPTSVDNRLAEKQATWLEKVLANDHENIRGIPIESNCQTDKSNPCLNIPYSSNFQRHSICDNFFRVRPLSTVAVVASNLGLPNHHFQNRISCQKMAFPAPSTSSQHWNAAAYADNAHFVPALGQPLVDLLQPQSGERILDLGCGDGALTEKLVALGAQVLGIDNSPDMIAAALRRGLDARVPKRHQQ